MLCSRGVELLNKEGDKYVADSKMGLCRICI